MDEERHLQETREIHEIFPDVVLLPLGMLENMRRHYTNSETQTAPSKKVRKGNVQGSHTEIEMVRALSNLLR